MGLIDIRHRIALNTPHKETASGAIASFSTDLSAPAAVVADITAVQEGSGDPSPSNVRSISGWTGANVVRTGRNLLDGSKRYAYSSTIVYVGQDENGYKTFLSAGTYTLKVQFLNSVHYGAFYEEKANPGTATIWTGNSVLTEKTFTIDKTGWYKFWFYKSGGVSSDNIGNVWLVHGSEAGEYTPFVANTVYPISWQTAAGTVYGGTLDTVTGVLTVDRALVSVDGTGWSESGTSQKFYKEIVTSGGIAGSVDQISNMYPYSGIASGGSTYVLVDNSFYLQNQNNGRLRAWVYDTSRSLSDIGTLFDATPLTITYTLATPLTYQLTAVEITTILGENHIWADTGNSSVTYWTH